VPHICTLEGHLQAQHALVLIQRQHNLVLVTTAGVRCGVVRPARHSMAQRGVLSRGKSIKASLLHSSQHSTVSSLPTKCPASTASKHMCAAAEPHEHLALITLHAHSLPLPRKGAKAASATAAAAGLLTELAAAGPAWGHCRWCLGSWCLLH
jgi:hypothetical protein